MTVVSNAGPLIILSKLGLLHMLARLYGSTLVPMEVYDEVVVEGLAAGHSDAYVVRTAVERGEIVVAPLTDDDDAGIMTLPLGRGEKHAIRLAMTVSVDWVLLDDLDARVEAARRGLRVKGTLGVIVDAYRAKLLDHSERDLIFKALSDRDDIWLNPALIQRVWSALQGGRLTADRSREGFFTSAGHAGNAIDG